jgi:hypothetical protein
MTAHFVAKTPQHDLKQAPLHDLYQRMVCTDYSTRLRAAGLL